MNIGQLRQRITILRPPGPDDVDGAGQPLDDWPIVGKVWAAVEPLYGREFFASMQVDAQVTTRIRMRYRADIDRTMIARVGKAEYSFMYIIHPNFDKKELVIMCKERP